MFINPEQAIERLTKEFQANKARIWEDETLPLEKKGPEVERLWREFDRQREELRAVEAHASSKRMILPRRRRRQWK